MWVIKLTVVWKKNIRPPRVCDFAYVWFQLHVVPTFFRKLVWILVWMFLVNRDLFAKMFLSKFCAHDLYFSLNFCLLQKDHWDAVDIHTVPERRRTPRVQYWVKSMIVSVSLFRYHTVLWGWDFTSASVTLIPVISAVMSHRWVFWYKVKKKVFWCYSTLHIASHFFWPTSLEKPHQLLVYLALP